MISEELIQQVRDRIDIVDIISEDLNLKQAGNTFKALSPFTSEKTPSFVVSRDKQIFKCFSSGKGGNIFTYMQEMHGMGFPEAVRELGARVGIQIDTKNPEDRFAPDLFDIHARAENIYTEHLGREHSAKAYLEDRGFTYETIALFGIGYSPDDWETMPKVFKDTDPSLLTASGIFGKGKTGRLYDRFKGRLIFPIRNYLGKTIAFGGRNLNPESTKAKYVNSPETKLYNKSAVLYGLDLARPMIKECGTAILTEGYTDVMAMYQAGFQNTVSTSGTSITKDMVKTLSKFCNKVIILFDGDPAGKKAVFKAIPLCLSQGINVVISILPDGKDPADIIMSEGGTEKMKTILSDFKRPIEFLHDHHYHEGMLTDPMSRAKAVRECISLLTEGMPALEAELYIKEISEYYGASREALTAAAEIDRDRPTPAEYEAPEIWKSEEYILAYALKSHDNLRFLREDLDIYPEIFGTPTATNIYEYILDSDEGKSPLDELLNNESCPQRYKEMAAGISINNDITDDEKSIKTLRWSFHKIREGVLTQESQDIIKKIGQAKSEAEISALMKQNEEVNRQRLKHRAELAQ